MKKLAGSALIGMLCLLWLAPASARQSSPPSQAPAQQPQKPGGFTQVPPKQEQAPPNVNEWYDDFDASQLDSSKWMKFSIEGGPANTVVLSNGMLKLRGTPGTRAGVRSTQLFFGDRFIAEAKLNSVSTQMPEPGQSGIPTGFANLTVLFDGDGRNRLEWVLRSDGRFEAWSVVDFRGQRIDNNTLGTKEKSPMLAIVRRGDEFLFILNGQVGLTKVIPNMPKRFAIFLYGYGTSETSWDAARVVTTR